MNGGEKSREKIPLRHIKLSYQLTTMMIITFQWFVIMFVQNQWYNTYLIQSSSLSSLFIFFNSVLSQHVGCMQVCKNVCEMFVNLCEKCFGTIRRHICASVRHIVDGTTKDTLVNIPLLHWCLCVVWQFWKPDEIWRTLANWWSLLLSYKIITNGC